MCFVLYILLIQDRVWSRAVRAGSPRPHSGRGPQSLQTGIRADAAPVRTGGVFLLTKRQPSRVNICTSVSPPFLPARCATEPLSLRGTKEKVHVLIPRIDDSNLFFLLFHGRFSGREYSRRPRRLAAIALSRSRWAVTCMSHSSWPLVWE